MFHSCLPLGHSDSGDELLMTGQSSVIPATLPFTSIILCLGMCYKNPDSNLPFSIVWNFSYNQGSEGSLETDSYETSYGCECLLAVYVLPRFLAAVVFHVHK